MRTKGMTQSPWVQKRLNRGSESGFTLVELLVVVLIIGILSGIVVLSVSNSSGDAKVKACQQNAINLVAALDYYKASSDAGNGVYPTAAAAAAGSGTYAGYKLYTTAELTSALVPKFIKSIPTGLNAYVKTSDNTLLVVGDANVEGCKDVRQGA